MSRVEYEYGVAHPTAWYLKSKVCKPYPCPCQAKPITEQGCSYLLSWLPSDNLTGAIAFAGGCTRRIEMSVLVLAGWCHGLASLPSKKKCSTQLTIRCWKACGQLIHFQCWITCVPLMTATRIDHNRRDFWKKLPTQNEWQGISTSIDPRTYISITQKGYHP